MERKHIDMLNKALGDVKLTPEEDSSGRGSAVQLLFSGAR